MAEPAQDDTESREIWPNPVRTLLLFILGLWAIYRYHYWVGGTGGFDPARMTAEYSDCITWTQGSLVPFFIHCMGLPVLVLGLGGLLVALLRTGRAGAEAGLRYAVLSSEPRWLPGAARFWAVAARVAAWGGALIGLLAVGVAWVTVYRVNHLGHVMEWDTYSDLIWGARRWAEYAPLAGLLFGRIVFGALAEGARVRSGEGHRPVFSWLQDLALLALFTIPWFWHWMWTGGR